MPAFKNDIENSDIVQNPAADLTGLVTQYNEILTEILDKHAPLKTCNLKLRVTQPWYDKNVRTTKHKLRNAERKWRKSKCPDDYVSFSTERTNYINVLRKTKIDHFNSLIRENENDQKQLFKVVKDLCKSST